jgi:hypothetical protein
VNSKTIESINKLKDIGLEFDRLKNELEMMHIAYNAKKYWVGLTDEEIEGAIDEGFAFGLDDGNVSNKYVIRYARAIEAKLKEKNGN